MADDGELLRRAARGDGAAFALLVERHGRYLFGVAHALLGRDDADAEDVVQETLTAAVTGSFRGESSVRTWLVKILVRQAAMRRRADRRRAKRVVAEGDLSDARLPDPPVTGVAGAATEARIDLTAMLATLSEEHRTVLVLRELEGLSYREVADALDVPVGTVESRLYRAREALRSRFKGYL